MGYRIACLIIAGWIGLLASIFLFKYMPRIEQIANLQKRLKAAEKRNLRLSEKYTLEVIGRTDDAACYAIQMGEKQSEIEQQKNLATKWAAEAEKFRRKAEDAEK